MGINFSSIARDVEKKTTIPVDERAVYKILQAIATTGDFWQIVKLSEETLPVVAETINILESIGIIRKENNKIILTIKEFPSLEEYFCRYCSGRGIDLERYRDTIQEYRKIVKNRPPALQKFDQGYVTPETSIARAVFMHSKGDVEGRNILILGDDDLMSLALPLIATPEKITVIEIDERYVKFIEKESRKRGWNFISARKYDVRKPLPLDLRNAFDTFHTDPTESLIGLKLFLGRMISALKGPRCAGYFSITRVESSVYKWRSLQKMLLNDFNVVITDILWRFSEYVNWDYAPHTRANRLAPVHVQPSQGWYTSSFFRIETLRDSKGYEAIYEGEIYEDSESSTT